MAGAGYKLFNTGDVLTAAQVNTYLMEQTVMVFADAAARTTALTGVVSEGMISYLKDTNAVEVYNGSAWVSSDDPNAIQNTIVDAKGDLITATASDVPARLAVGNNGETLVADSSASTGLRWQGDYAAGKNKLINANMVIDQRNAGASVTVNATPAVFSVDRWFGSGVSSDGVFTLQQDSSAPSGFTKSIKATITTADTSIPATGGYNLTQIVEGFNIADLGYGSAGAKTTTLSFWVRSSVTGTFGGSLRNSATNRSYPFTYSISVADTWEQKSITIAGDTSGTWLTDSGIGIRLTFAFGSGADRLGTAGAWAGASYNGATGQTQLIGTLNATWYITGVQLEVGSVATAFQTATGTLAGELAACQRYYEKSLNIATDPTTALQGGYVTGKVASNTVAAGERYGAVFHKVTKRGTPTVTIRPYTTPTNTGRVSNAGGTDLGANSGAAVGAQENGFTVYNNSGGTLTTTELGVIFHYESSAEL